MIKFLFLVLFFFAADSANCQTADFSISSPNNIFCTPSTVTFTQTSSGNPTSFLWDFGNGTFGDQPSQSASYSIAGSYTVKLIAIYSNTNSVSVSKVVVINPAVTASIAVDRNYICQPGSINFTGSGTGNITNYQWNFADSSPISNLATSAISHPFSNFGSKNVTLTTTTDKGCSAVANITINVRPIATTGGVSKPNGCVPATISFGTNTPIPRNSTITSYTWNYGDGSAPTVSLSNSSTHVYPLVGQYFSSVNVVTSEGCTGTFNFTRLYFGTPPTGQIAYVLKDSVCGSETVTFVTTATNADRYYWDFGDGFAVSTTDTLIQHKYATVGNKTIYVNAYYNGCAAAAAVVKMFIKGVVANYTFKNTCSNKDAYLFTDTSSGVSTGNLWVFGDGIQQSDTPSYRHQFSNPGQFNTKLVVYDSLSGCSDSVSRVIYTASPQVISPDSAVCKYSTVNFDISGNAPNGNAQYTWTVLGNQQAIQSATPIAVTANALGSYSNFVIINSGSGYCLDTIYLNRQIIVRGPKLDFTSPPSVCFKIPVTITNNSTPFLPADSIVTTYWNYGNVVKNDSIYQPPAITYSSPGTYNIKLSAIDINGCKDSLIKPVTVFPLPFLRVVSARDTICYGTFDSLIAVHSNTILWSPSGNLSCTACDTTIATPPTSTLYYATAINTFNCSVQDSTFVQVSIPFTATIDPAVTDICQFQSTAVNVLPKGKVITWSPPAGLSDAGIYNPVIAPAKSTIYTVVLHDSAGCISNSSSASLNLIIKSLPTVNAGPDEAYGKGAVFSFAPTYSNNVSTYLWTPSDFLSCNNCAFPNGINDHTQQYIIKVTSDSGCVASDSVIISIACKYANLLMPKAFTPNNDNLNDYFYPISVGIKLINRFIIYDRKGQVVFEARNFTPNNRNLGWDGRFKGAEQSIGTYVYILEAICDLGEKLFKKDSFLLLR